MGHHPERDERDEGRREGDREGYTRGLKQGRSEERTKIFAKLRELAKDHPTLLLIAEAERQTK